MLGFWSGFGLRVLDLAFGFRVTLWVCGLPDIWLALTDGWHLHVGVGCLFWCRLWGLVLGLVHGATMCMWLPPTRNPILTSKPDVLNCRY